MDNIAKELLPVNLTKPVPLRILVDGNWFRRIYTKQLPIAEKSEKLTSHNETWKLLQRVVGLKNLKLKKLYLRK